MGGFWFLGFVSIGMLTTLIGVLMLEDDDEE